MSSAVADFPDIVHSHHYPIVVDEFFEWFSINEFEEGCPFGNIDSLHKVQSSDYVLQRPTGIDSTNVGMAYLIFLGCRAVSV